MRYVLFFIFTFIGLNVSTSYANDSKNSNKTKSVRSKNRVKTPEEIDEAAGRVYRGGD